MKFLSYRINQSGLSLIELMIAMTLGLVITGAVIQAFLSTNQTYRMQEAQSRMQENGWAAIHFLTQDIRMADFWGCLPDRSEISSSIDLLNNPQFDYANISGITGTENGGFNNSDSISINKASEQGSMLQNNMANSSSNLSVNAGNSFEVDDIVLITDCISGDLFQISGVGGGSFEHNLNGAEAPRNSSNQFYKTYTAGAQLFTVEPVVQYGILNNAGKPKLFRRRGDGNRQSLIENIEQMQILYGENTDNTDGADRYVQLASVTDMGEVQSVRISLLVRSDADNLAAAPQSYIFDNFDNDNTNDNHIAGDRRIRQVFTTTISIRNHLN